MTKTVSSLCLSRRPLTVALFVTMAALHGCQRAEPPAPAAEKPAPASTAAPASAAPAPVASQVVASASMPASAASSAVLSAPAARNLKAFGFSPAWTAEVHGAELALMVPEMGAASVDAPPPRAPAERHVDGDVVQYKGQLSGKDFALTIKNGPCERATEGGTPRAFHATLTYAGSTYHGCADALP